MSFEFGFDVSMDLILGVLFNIRGRFNSHTFRFHIGFCGRLSSQVGIDSTVENGTNPFIRIVPFNTADGPKCAK